MLCLPLLRSAPLVVITLLSGCSNAIDSLTAERIQITDATPPDGRVGQPYSFRITANVKNEPNDENFDYRFSHADGTLPPGTAFSTNREPGNDFALVSGTPTTPGSFTFAVAVHSQILERRREQGRIDKLTDRNSNGDSAITSSTEGLYTIVINPR